MRPCPTCGVPLANNAIECPDCESSVEESVGVNAEAPPLRDPVGRWVDLSRIYLSLLLGVGGAALGGALYGVPGSIAGLLAGAIAGYLVGTLVPLLLSV